MVNTKRARKEKSRRQPSGGTYVEPKDLLSGLERVREAAIRHTRKASGPGLWLGRHKHYFLDLWVQHYCTHIRINVSALDPR